MVKASVVGKRVSPGRKGFNLDYVGISNEYLEGKTLKELCKKYNISQWTLLDNFKKLGVRKTTKRYQNVDVFKCYTKESCYWAGFLAADGFTREYYLASELSFIDEPHLILLKSFLQSNADISRRTRINKENSKKYKYSSVYFYSKELSTVLKEKFNIVPNKSLVYQPPTVPKEFQSHFIRGYIDGDGSIGWHNDNNKPRVHFGSGSIEIVKWIREVFQKNIKNVGEPKLSINTNNRNKPFYSTEYMGWQTQEILNWLYENSNDEIRLKRKYDDYMCFLDRLIVYEKILSEKQNNKKAFIEQLEELYTSGLSSKDISNKLKIGQQKVLYNLRKSNIRKKTSNSQNINGMNRRERDLNMLNSYQLGNKPKEIALKNNIALSSFWVAIRRVKNIEA